MVAVTDASLWVSVLVRRDTNYAASRRWLESTLRQSRDGLIAPLLLLAEVGGAVARRTGSARLGQQAIAKLLGGHVLRLIATDDHLGLRAAEIAVHSQLRGADAVYVALAEDLHLPLITWDQEQIARVQDLISAQTPK